MPSTESPLRLFCIGNSFSGNATTYLPELAREAGHEIQIGRAQVGGCSLQRHWDAVLAAESGNEDGEPRLYDGNSLRELLGDGNWDIVTLQQASRLSPHASTYQPYGRQLHDYVRELCPNAEIVVHQTWAYRCDASQFGEVVDGQQAQSQREMWENSRAAYHEFAKELGLRVIPVGDAFWRADSDANFGYSPDRNFDFENPQLPNLPNQANSLHAGYYWSEEGEFRMDANHASVAGCYLGSLVWFGFLFDRSPESVEFAPSELDSTRAKQLRSVAAQTLESTPQLQQLQYAR